MEVKSYDKECLVPDEEERLLEGDVFTIAGIGTNKRGDIIRRIRNIEKEPPFWGINLRTGKRGKAYRLMNFKVKNEKENADN